MSTSEWTASAHCSTSLVVTVTDGRPSNTTDHRSNFAQPYKDSVPPNMPSRRCPYPTNHFEASLNSFPNEFGHHTE